MAVYGPFATDLLTSYLASKTIKAMLVDSTYVQNVDNQYRSAIASHEISGTGYTAGGVTATLTASYDSSGDTPSIGCGTVDFGSITASGIGGIVFYVSTGDAATDVLIAADTWTPADASGPFTYTPAAGGLIVVTLS